MMQLPQILADIDNQIAKLQEARALLAGEAAAATTPRAGRGRPKGSKNVASSAAPKNKAKRTLTPEGRKRIQEAMKKRWAARRNAVAAKQ